VYSEQQERYTAVLDAHRAPPGQAQSLHAATARLGEVAR
jgi:hypothetical protein